MLGVYGRARFAFGGGARNYDTPRPPPRKTPLLRWGVRPVCGGEAASGAEEVTEVGDRVKWGKGAKVTPWGMQRQGAID